MSISASPAGADLHAAIQPVGSPVSNEPAAPAGVCATLGPQTMAAVFSPSGELISGDAKNRLPLLLLGYQDQLMIEPLPPQATAAWSKSADVTLIVDEQGTTCPAKEETRFSIIASKAPVVHLARAIRCGRRRMPRGFPW